MQLIIAAVARRRAQILKALGDLLGDRQWRQLRAHHPSEIQEAASKRPEASLLVAKQFLILGNRAALDQAMRWLAVRGKLVKIARGRDALPISSRFGTRPPAPEAVIAQLNRQGAQQLVSSCMTDSGMQRGEIPGFPELLVRIALLEQQCNAMVRSLW